LDTSTGLEDDPAVHVLTKIFIVLVSLLSVMLVPLVVTYVHNEDAYKAKFQEADAQRIAARSTLEIAQASFAAASTRKDNEIAERTSTIRDLERQLVQKSQELQSATARLAEAENLDAQIMGQISILSNAMDAGQKLTESLIQEVRQLRREQLAAERQKVELDEALRDSQSQLEVSQRALRAMQEEVQRIRDENASVLSRLSQYVAAHGELGPRAREVAAGAMIDVDLDARVMRVRRTAEQTLAEIDAGSRDGVKVGWVVVIGRDDFIANLRITYVDINTATGVVEMENPQLRGRVEVGDRVLIRTSR